MREIMLIIHFIGLAMGVGTSFAMMFIGFISSKMEAKEAEKFSLQAYKLGTMGHIGLTLSILTGGYLMTPFWKILPTNPALIIKLSLVVVLLGLLGVISSLAKKAKNGNSAEIMKKIKSLGIFTMLISITIITLAVYVFK